MSNNQKANTSVMLGAAFLMATSAIGPGFLTQTATFTSSLGSSFGFVVLISLIMAAIAQMNIWRVLCYTGKRGQDVANEVHLSQSHFSTIFAQETGLTFTQYLTALRIGKARELLEATEMRSAQIATEVGYNDSHYFSYLFKKNTGATPGEYRKNSRNE